MIAANGGKIDGKTTIQKLTYFSKLKVPLKEDPVFRPHYYGPYSANVDFELDKLVALGFLEQSSRPTINQRIMYSYKLTRSGKSILSGLVGRYPEQFDTISSIVATCRKYSGLNPTSLSYAAKVHYVSKSAIQPMSSNEVAEEARDNGWEIDERGIQRGLRILSGLKLVKQPISA
ncbi:MAG: hypothetical protein ACRECH_13015 [Nitrososphaerales archaeon]